MTGPYVDKREKNLLAQVILFFRRRWISRFVSSYVEKKETGLTYKRIKIIGRSKVLPKYYRRSSTHPNDFSNCLYVKKRKVKNDLLP